MLVGADQVDREFAQRRRLGVAEGCRNAVLLQLVVAVRVGDGRAGRDVDRLVRARARARVHERAADRVRARRCRRGHSPSRKASLGARSPAERSLAGR